MDKKLSEIQLQQQKLDQKNRQAFADTLKQWLALNNWPQSITESVANAKGNATGPWGSQISYAVNAKHTPEPNFFVAIGWFNMIIATRDFQDIPAKICAKLIDSQPLCHDNGEPYESTDFFRLYVGILKPPVLRQPTLEEDLLASLPEATVQRVLEIMEKHLINP